MRNQDYRPLPIPRQTCRRCPVNMPPRHATMNTSVWEHARFWLHWISMMATSLAGSSDVTGVASSSRCPKIWMLTIRQPRSEEHTSELQSLRHLVCRLLLEKKSCGGIGAPGCAPAGGAFGGGFCATAGYRRKKATKAAAQKEGQRLHDISLSFLYNSGAR